MENLLEGKVYGFKEVVKSSIEVCKSKYKELFLINLVILLCSSSGNFINLWIGNNVDNLQLVLVAYLIMIVLLLVGGYFSTRFTIVQMYGIYNHIHKIHESVSDRYKRAGKVVWRYIGVALLFGLMLLAIYVVAVIIIAVAYIVSMNSLSPSPVAIGVITITIMGGLVGICFLCVKYYFACIIKVFSPDEDNYFQKSSQLVKGRFFSVLGLFLLPMLIQLPVMALTIYLSLSDPGNQLMGTGITYLLTLVTGPFVTTGIVVMYLLLGGNVDQEQNLENIK